MDHDTILCLGCLSWKALLYACAGTNQAIEDTLFPNNRPFQAFPVFNVIDDIFAFKCWCWFGTNTTLFNGALIETMKATRRNRLKVYRSVFGLKIDILYLIFAPRSLGKTLHWGASADLLQRLLLVALIVKQSTDTYAGSIHLSATSQSSRFPNKHLHRQSTLQNLAANWSLHGPVPITSIAFTLSHLNYFLPQETHFGSIYIYHYKSFISISE